MSGLSVRYLEDGLLVTDTDGWGWWRLGLVPYEFLDDPARGGRALRRGAPRPPRPGGAPGGALGARPFGAGGGPGGARRGLGGGRGGPPPLAPVGDLGGAAIELLAEGIVHNGRRHVRL